MESMTDVSSKCTKDKLSRIKIKSIALQWIDEYYYSCNMYEIKTAKTWHTIITFHWMKTVAILNGCSFLPVCRRGDGIGNLVVKPASISRPLRCPGGRSQIFDEKIPTPVPRPSSAGVWGSLMRRLEVLNIDIDIVMLWIWIHKIVESAYGACLP